MEKHCSKCKKLKPLDAFYKGRNKHNGRQSICKVCMRIVQQSPEYKETKRKYAQSQKFKDSVLRRQYGISLEQYKIMHNLQENKCAICKTHQDDFKNAFSVDHDHSCCSGKISCGKCIRGLLCDNCNHGIGKFKDSTKLLQSAIIYLEAKNEQGT